jgi:hypothetical protein
MQRRGGDNNCNYNLNFEHDDDDDDKIHDPLTVENITSDSFWRINP